MLDWGNIGSGILEVIDSLIDPALVPFSEAEKIFSALFFVGILLFFYGSFKGSLPAGLGKIVLPIAIIFCIAFISSGINVRMLIVVMVVFGALLKIIGGALLVRYFFETPIAALVYGVLMVVSIIFHKEISESFGLGRSTEIKLIVVGFSSIGTYRFLRDTKFGSQFDSPQLLYRITGMLALVSLIDFAESSANPTLGNVQWVIGKSSFIGMIASTGIQVFQRR
jgi:hypothetical protein